MSAEQSPGTQAANRVIEAINSEIEQFREYKNCDAIIVMQYHLYRILKDRIQP